MSDSTTPLTTSTGAAAHLAKPIVLVPGCSRQVGDHACQIVGTKYLDAVRLAGCLPLVVPGVAAEDLDALLDLADGVLLTGSPSNVHPRHFGEAVHDIDLPLDPDRDAWTLPLIPRVLARGLPLFAICRGFQETNVALGGTLHQAVQEQPGLHDHRDATGEVLEIAYAARHPVDIVAGGQLATMLAPLLGSIPGSGANSLQVNSLHGQGVRTLAPGLRCEAVAPDGLVEAFSVESAPGFALAVQWHPEWQAERNPASMALLGAFGDACRAFHDSKVIQPVKTVKRTATAISIRSTTLQQNTAHAMRDPET